VDDGAYRPPFVGIINYTYKQEKVQKNSFQITHIAREMRLKPAEIDALAYLNYIMWVSELVGIIF
jgi:hypothetical protein